MQSLSKEQKEWNKQLNQQLQRYSLLRDWSQLASWLARVKTLLQEYRGAVVQKMQLLRRLATSLNPSLPAPLHEATLDIYELLFTFSLSPDTLQSVCLALFPFYTQTNYKNKHKLLALFSARLPPYASELHLLATGLLITVLPSFAEVHEALVKEVTAFIHKLEQLFGADFFMQSLWIAVLRSPACRMAGLRFVSEWLGKAEEDDQEEEDNFWTEGSNLISNQQPFNLNNTPANNVLEQEEVERKDWGKQEQVISALEACLYDANILTVKAGLDFLFKYAPLKSQLLSDVSKLRLSTPIIALLARRDVSVTRKVNLWLFNKPDEQNRFTLRNHLLPFIIRPLRSLLQKDSSLDPLKILFNLYSEHEQLITRTLPQLAKDTIGFCIRQEAHPQVGKLISRLIDRVKGSLDVMNQSVGSEMLEAVRMKDFALASHLLGLLTYFLNKILKAEEIQLVLVDVLRAVMEGYALTAWEDTAFMSHSLKSALELLDTHKQLLIVKPPSETSPRKPLSQIHPILDAHKALHSQLLLLLKHLDPAQENAYETHLVLLNSLQLRLYEVFSCYNVEWTTNLIENVKLVTPACYLPAIQAMAEGIEREGPLSLELNQRAHQQNQSNWVRSAVYKLWAIVDINHLQTTAIALLLRLTKKFPQFLQALLQAQFSGSSETTILKFSIFWEHSNKQLQIVSHDQLQTICRAGLFRMLKFLDTGNPLVKYHANIWINCCASNFNRVLNPLLQEILANSGTWYRTFQGQYVYVSPPQITPLKNTLHMLKSLIRSTGSKLNKFMVKPLNPALKALYESLKARVSLQPTYFAFMLQLLIRLTESRPICMDGEGVDLLSCEVFECVVQETDLPQLCNYIVSSTVHELLRSLHFAIINKEPLLQVQLLTLLKSIFLTGKMRQITDEKLFKQCVMQSTLISTLLQGLISPLPYVKERFVQFLSETYLLLVQYHSHCSQKISTVFNVYIDEIKILNAERGGGKDYRKETEIIILFKGVKDLLGFFVPLQVLPFEKEKNQSGSDAGMFSLYSWKSFVQLQLTRRIAEQSKMKKQADQLGKELMEQLPSLMETMTECWRLSTLSSHYELAPQGMALFNYEHFHTFNKELYGNIARFQGNQGLDTFVVALVRVLLNSYPHQLLSAILNNWILVPASRLNILEILNFSCLPLEQFYYIIGTSFQQSRQKKKKNIFVVQIGVQPQVIHFAHVFTHYSFQNINVFQANNLLSLWVTFCGFLRQFQQTSNILSLYSVLQLLDLFMQKNSPKEILQNERLRKEMICVATMLNDLLAVCSGKTQLTTTIISMKLKDIMPLTPSVVVQLWREDRPKYLQFEQISGARALQYVRLQGFVIMKRIGYQLYTNVYGENEVVKKIREVLQQLLPLVEDKSLPPQYAQSASDVILALLEKRTAFLREFKQEILQVFNKDQFFICSLRTLQAWARLIDLIIDANKQHPVFEEYLGKVSLVSSIFSSQTLETKKKIKSFERICFILYAGGKDKFNDKAHLLIDKLIEVIKSPDAPQPVLILIFFCIRILIVRTSADRLSKLMSSVWHLLLSLFVHVFSKDPTQLNLVWAALKLIEALSAMDIAEFHPHQWMFFYDFVGIQFTTRTNNHNSSSLHINNHPNNINNHPNNINNKMSNKEQKISEFTFAAPPHIHRFLPDSIYIVRECNIAPVITFAQNSPSKSQLISSVQINESPFKLKTSQNIPSNQIINQTSIEEEEEMRHLIIKEDKIDDMQLLKTKALMLSAYLVRNNQRKLRFDPKEIQELIDSDFLNLDQFIFRFK